MSNVMKIEEYRIGRQRFCNDVPIEEWTLSLYGLVVSALLPPTLIALSDGSFQVLLGVMVLQALGVLLGLILYRNPNQTRACPVLLDFTPSAGSDGQLKKAA